MKEEVKINNIINIAKFAHRGLHNKNISENTIESFKRAIEYDLGIELDIRITKDKEIVVLHDENLKSTIGIDINIDEIKYKELIKYNIPLLEDVLDLLEGTNTNVLLEIKTSSYRMEVNKKVYSMLKNRNIRFAIISFDPKIVKWFKERNILTGQTLSKKIPRFFLWIIINRIIKYTKADFLVVEKELLNSLEIKKIRKKYFIIGWTIKSKEEEEKYSHLCDNYIFEGYL